MLIADPQHPRFDQRGVTAELREEMKLKTTKLVIGILSIVLTLLVMFQSCAAGIGDAMMNEGGTSGASGFLVALFMLIAGIVAIAARNSRGGSLCCTLLYALAGLLGISADGIYKDLMIWGMLCLIFAAVFLIFTLLMKKQPDSSEH